MNLFKSTIGANLKYKSAPAILSSSNDLFRLPKTFVKQYDPILDPSKKTTFGFNGVGELAYKRSYARVRDDLGGR